MDRDTKVMLALEVTKYALVGNVAVQATKNFLDTLELATGEREAMYAMLDYLQVPFPCEHDEHISKYVMTAVMQLTRLLPVVETEDQHATLGNLIMNYSYEFRIPDEKEREEFTIDRDGINTASAKALLELLYSESSKSSMFQKSEKFKENFEQFFGSPEIKRENFGLFEKETIEIGHIAQKVKDAYADGSIFRLCFREEFLELSWKQSHENKDRDVSNIEVETNADDDGWADVIEWDAMPKH